MKMRTFGWFVGILVAGATLVGCEDDNVVVRRDLEPPATPQNVYSITADELIILRWTGSTEADLAGYRVLRSRPQDDYFDLLAELWHEDYAEPDELIAEWEYLDDEVSNGLSYEYAVVAFDYDDNESQPSDIYGRVIDVPRPEGFNVRIDSDETLDAFDFWNHDRERAEKVRSSDIDADIIVAFDTPLNALFVEVSDPDYVEIQDFGFTSSLDELDFAPTDGWSGLGWAELIEGHSYVVRIFDGNEPNYGKFRVFDMGATWIRMDWAYQTREGVRQYKRAPEQDNARRPSVERRYQKHQAQGGE